MARENGEAHEQAQQVGEDHPLVMQVGGQTAQTGARLEPGERELVQHDCRKPTQGHGQNVVVKHRDAQQRQGEQDEIERNAQDG
jgi:hypothetical protein